MGPFFSPACDNVLIAVVPSFERPSAIQQRAIVPVIKGHDVIAQAQSGTGKTATFSISILQKVREVIPIQRTQLNSICMTAGHEH